MLKLFYRISPSLNEGILHGIVDAQHTYRQQSGVCKVGPEYKW